MRQVLAALLLSMLMLSGSAAYARDGVWTCSYPGYGGSKRVVVNFGQRGSKLTTDDGESYLVLKDNDVGLIAVRSFSYVDEESTYAPGLNLGAFVVLIDKRTNRFMRGNVIMDEGAGATSYGSCSWK